MADIRIKDLATTASSTASDDFVAIDGSANGTRKLSAYSPTFGGNLTVSGTGTSSVAGNLDVKKDLFIYGSNASSAGGITAESAAGGLYFYGQGTSTGMRFYTTNGSAASQLVLSLESTKQATFEGNLVVAGTGTSSVAGSLGVGTTSPYTKLDVRGGSAVVTTTDFVSGSAGTVGAFFLGSTTGNTFLQIQSGTSGDTVSGNVVINRYGGNLLLGTTTDSGQKLQVAGSVKIANNLSIFGGNASSAGTITANSAAGGLYFLNEGTSTGMRFYVTDGSANPVLAQTLDATTGNATFAGSIAIGNTVNTVSPTSPNRTITIVVGGTTYYIHAKTTND